MDEDIAENYAYELTKNGPIELETYGHQVGGHSLLMKFGKAICKPLIPREHLFYTSAPQELLDFTPSYHGKSLRGINHCVDAILKVRAEQKLAS